MDGLNKERKVYRVCIVVLSITCVVFYGLYAWQTADYDDACKCLANRTLDCKKYIKHGASLTGVSFEEL